MAQVSRNPLNTKIKKRIFEIFVEVVASLNKTAEINDFFDDLFSETEKMMLSKRLSIAYLLLKNYDQRNICQILKVSMGTVSRVSQNLQNKGRGYKGVLGKIFAREKIKIAIDKLDLFFNSLIPPPKGTDWNRQKKVYYARRSQRQNPF